MLIYHIADLHIKDTRREEYAVVFEQFIQEVSSGSKNNRIIVVIAGDIFEHKIRLSAHNILDYVAFINKLLQYADRVVSIMGNHDTNLNNPNAIDLISPLHKLLNHPRYHHYNETGSYVFIDYGIVINVQSPDGDLLYPYMQEDDALKNILLFHEDVDINFNGIRLKGRIKKDKLSKYDMVMGGHIHEYMEFAPNCVYSGALIQQNIGESYYKGYVRWDIDTCSHTFIPIYNKNGYMKFRIDRSNAISSVYKNYNMDNDATESAITAQPPTEPYRIVVEVDNDEKVSIDTDDIIKSLTTQYNIKPEIYTRRTSIMPHGNEVSNMEKQLVILRDELNGQPQHIIDQVLELHKSLDEKIPAVKNSVKLIRLEWENLYCYGGCNNIDFTDIDGTIAGIIAPNRHGKSAVVDILVFALYNKAIRGDRKHIINKACKQAYIRVKFMINQHKHDVIREFYGTGSNKITHIVDDVNVTDSDISTVYKNIEDLIGPYDDFISTVIITQTRLNDYIYMSHQHRAEYLSRILGLDILKKNLEYVRAERQKIRGIFKQLGCTVAADANSSIEEDKKQIETEQKIVSQLQCELVQCKKYIDDNKDTTIPPLMYNINELRQKIDRLKDVSIPQQYELSDSAADLKNKYQEASAQTPLKPCWKGAIPSYTQHQLDNVMGLTANELNHFEQERFRLEMLLHHTDINQVKKAIKRFSGEEVIIEDRPRILPILSESFRHDLVKYHRIPYEQLVADMNIWNRIEECKQKIKPVNASIIELLKTYGTSGQIQSKINSLVESKNLFISDKLKNAVVYSKQCECCKKNKALIQTGINESNIKNNSKKLDKYMAIKEKVIKAELQQKQQLINNKMTEQIKLLKAQLNTQLQHAAIKYAIDNFKQIQLNIDVGMQLDQINKAIKYEEYVKNKSLLNAANQLHNYVEMLMVAKYKKYQDALANYETHIKEVQELKQQYKIDKKQRLLHIYEKALEEEKKYTVAMHIINQVKATYIKIASVNEEINSKQAVINKLLKQIEIKKVCAQDDILKIYEKCLNYKTGIPIKILNKALNVMADHANQLLANVCDFKIVFKLESTKLSLYVVDKTREIPVELCSGFQKFILSLILRYTFMKISNKSIPEFLIIDEGFGCLDAVNMQHVINVIPQFKNIYSFIIIITHIDLVKECIEKPMHVVRNPDTMMSQLILGAPMQLNNNINNIINNDTASIITPMANDPTKLYCSVCRKALSSAVYLNKHIKSKLHITKLERYNRRETAARR